jgi:hypothetical protein
MIREVVSEVVIQITVCLRAFAKSRKAPTRPTLDGFARNLALQSLIRIC